MSSNDKIDEIWKEGLDLSEEEMVRDEMRDRL